MIGRLVGDLFICGLGVALAIIALVAIREGALSRSLLGRGMLLDGCIIVALLMIFVQLRSAANAQAASSASSQRILCDLIIAATTEQNRAELAEVRAERREARRREEHRRARMVTVTAVLLAVAMIGVIWMATRDQFSWNPYP